MKRFSEQLKKKSESVRLSRSERFDMRERLAAYMEYHPLPQGNHNAIPTINKKRVHTLNINFFLAGKVFGAFAMIMLVVVPAVAEKAIPGDILYPVKVRFNEEVRSQLALTPYQKVEWETERLERRIAEARLLADAGKLTPEAEAEVAEAVKQHSDAAKEGIATIRESDSEEADIAELTLASALEVQSEVLEGHLEKKQASSTPEGLSIAALVGAVNAARADVEVKEGEALSYEKLSARLESETTKAYEYLESIDGMASPEEKGDIEKRLLEIKNKTEKSATYTISDKTVATNLLAEALTDTRKLISFMTNIDVRETININDLVPAELTDEERSLAVQSSIASSTNLKIELSEKAASLATSTDEYQKATTTLLQVNIDLDSASSSLSAGNLDAAEALTEKISKALADIAQLFATEEEEVEESEEENTSDSDESDT